MTSRKKARGAYAVGYGKLPVASRYVWQTKSLVGSTNCAGTSETPASPPAAEQRLE